MRPAHRATTRTEQPEPPVDTEEDLARVESQLAAMQDEPAPEFYAAVRCDEGHPRAGEVFAFVVLYSSSPRSVHNFTYKEMDETVLPGAVNAP